MHTASDLAPLLVIPDSLRVRQPNCDDTCVNGASETLQAPAASPQVPASESGSPSKYRRAGRKGSPAKAAARYLTAAGLPQHRRQAPWQQCLRSTPVPRAARREQKPR